jgi:hypothetical protein
VKQFSDRHVQTRSRFLPAWLFSRFHRQSFNWDFPRITRAKQFCTNKLEKFASLWKKSESRVLRQHSSLTCKFEKLKSSRACNEQSPGKSLISSDYLFRPLPRLPAPRIPKKNRDHDWLPMAIFNFLKNARHEI